MPVTLSYARKVVKSPYHYQVSGLSFAVWRNAENTVEGVRQNRRKIVAFATLEVALICGLIALGIMVIMAM